MTKVRLFGALRDRVGRNEVDLPGGTSLMGILASLAELYGEPVGRLLLEESDGTLKKRQPVVILISGRTQKDLDRLVTNGETVSIFPAVAGG
jgi:molybdopterin converting factor small subunit